MCGRFTLRVDLRAIAERFAARIPEGYSWVPRYNIAPTQTIVAVRRTAEGMREVAAMRWGLIPYWATDASLGRRLINARAETVAEKPAFRRAFRQRRCLVVADGYYEWQGSGRSAKQPYWIRPADQPLFAMAGLWERWRTPQGDTIESVAVITTVANEATRPIHHRIPAILPAALEPVWLGESPANREDLLGCLVPYPSSAMRVDPVSTYVSRPQNEGPECIAPVKSLFPTPMEAERNE